MLTKRAKKFSQGQMDLIVNSQYTNNPSYLSVLIDELCVVGTYETLSEQIKNYLQLNNVQTLYASVLERLEKDFGRDHVALILSVLLESRNGLDANELLEMAHDLSQVDWMSIYSTLREKFIEKCGLFSIGDHNLVEAIRTRYHPTQYIPVLTEFFRGKKLSERVAYELLYLYRKNGDWLRLRDLMLDMDLVKLMYNDRDKYELFEYWNLIQNNLHSHTNDPGACYTTALLDLSEKFAVKKRSLEDEIVGMNISKKGANASQKLAQISNEISEIPKKLGEYYYLAGEMTGEMAKYEVAVGFYEKALEIQEREFDTCDPNKKADWVLDIALTLEGIALVRRNFGEYISATDLCLRGISLIETYLHSSHSSLVAIINSLTTILGKRVKLTEAREWAERSVGIAEKGFGMFTLETAESSVALGVILKKMKLFKEAEIPLKRGLKIRQKLVGPLHSLCGNVYNDLGNLNAKLATWTKAIEYYKSTQKIAKRVFGEEHPSMSANLYNIGRALLKQGLLKEGLQHIIQAYLIARNVYGEDKVKTLKVKAQIFGVLQVKDSDPEKYELTCDILRDLLLPANPSVLTQFNIPLEKPKPVEVVEEPVVEEVEEEKKEEFYFAPEEPKKEKWYPRAVAFIPTEPAKPAPPVTGLSVFEMYMRSIQNPQQQQQQQDAYESSDEEGAAAKKEEKYESTDEDEAFYSLFF